MRWKLGLALLVFSVVGTTMVAARAPDATSRVIRIFECVGISLTVMLIWWLLLSGLRWRVRLFGLLGFVGAVLLVSKLAVTSVTFDGDMTPRFRFVWDPPPPNQVAEAWLRENAPTRVTEESIDAEPPAFTITETDWPRYAGWNGDRTITEPLCNLDWNPNPPKELWRHPVGEAWSSFAVVGNRLYTQEQRGEQECVVCYDADNGIELWRHEDTARYSTPQGGTGPRATPFVTTSAVLSLGATGILNALDPISGKSIWQHNICTDAGSSMLEWGMSGSPLMYGDTVIVDAGGFNNRAVIAYDVTTGDVRWTGANHKASYTAPRIDMIAGQETLLIFHGDGLAGMKPDDGTPLWEFPWTNEYKINVAQTMMFGNQVFLSSGYDAGCVMIDPTALDGDQPAEVWPRNKSMKLKFNEAVSLGQFVYGLDDGILACVDSRTGERVWKKGRYGFGQMLLWGDKLLVQAEKGFVAIVEATPKDFVEVTKFTALNDRTWNMPIVCRGKLYVRNASEAACFTLP